MVKRVCLVSSGTGGHLLPAMMLARALSESGHQPILLTEGRSPERLLLEQYPYRAETLAVGGPGPSLPLRLLRAWLRARRFLARERIDLVIGAGGRTTVPVGLAATSLGVPMVLMEQNAIPGRANRLLAPLARRIYLGLPSPRRPRNALVTGTPLRPELGRVGRDAAKRSLGLAAALPVVLVTGGSQGARALNTIVPAALCRLRRPVQVLHLCGAHEDEPVRQAYAAGAEHGLTAMVRCHAFDMATMYAAADLVICRGGGGTVAELAAAGRGAIIVPYPHHRDRQQYFNGKVLEDAGAAVVIEQRDLEPGALAAQVKGLLAEGRTAEMGAKASALARPDSCARILEDLAELGAR
jgi:UDP-N-acetylglucosamine--N-acetylmuramyl-(pentapeptide) pyrophosphoryl-undecaprenol N-acetylglucosamine transferase